jgi:hypothetical protein
MSRKTIREVDQRSAPPTYLIEWDRHTLNHMHWEPEFGPAQAVKITGLDDPEDDGWADEMYGLLCQARAEGRLVEAPLAECEGKKGSPNRQLLKDYAPGSGTTGDGE